MKLNKKGLTLIELLGVIVVIGIIAAVAYPLVTSQLSGAKQDAYATSVNNFVDAALEDAQRRVTLDDSNGVVFVYSVASADDSTTTLNIYEADETTQIGTAITNAFSMSKSIGFSGEIKITFTEAATGGTSGSYSVEVTSPLVGDYTVPLGIITTVTRDDLE